MKPCLLIRSFHRRACSRRRFSDNLGSSAITPLCQATLSLNGKTEHRLLAVYFSLTIQPFLFGSPQEFVVDPIFIGFGDFGLLAWSTFVGFGCVSSPLFMGVSVSLGVHRGRLTSGVQFLRFQATPNTSRRLPPSDIPSVPTLRGPDAMATRAVPRHKGGRTIPSEINSYAHLRLAYERPTARRSQRPQNFSGPHRRASFLRIGHDADNPRKVKRSSPRQLPTFPNSCAEP